MSKDWFDKIKTIVINNNTYQIFQAEKKDSLFTILFLWGKIDFKYEANISVDGSLVRADLAIKRNGVWYDFVKTSGHGIFFEETCWRNTEGKEVRIDTPAKFPSIADELARKVISQDRISA